MSNLNTTLRLFKAVVVKDHQTYNNMAEVKRIKDALFLRGIFIDEDTLTHLDVSAMPMDEIVRDADALYGVNLMKLNSSFYKTFSEMQSKSDFELFVDQILHYGSTYGEITWLQNHGDIYEPETLDNDTIVELQTKAKAFTIIEGITETELEDKINTLFSSGIALKSEDIADLMKLASHYTLEINPDTVANKEVQAILGATYGVLPRDFDAFMRVVFYKVTGTTLVIKDGLRKDQFLTMDTLKADAIAQLFIDYRNHYGIKAITENIMRYRKYILYIRKNASDCFNKFFNFILKQSKVDKKPRAKSVMANVVDSSVTVDMLTKSAENATIFQIVRAINVINERLSGYGRDAVPVEYRIRNGYSWITEKSFNVNSSDLQVKLYTLVAILRAKTNANFKDKVVFAPIDYKVPTSTKTFVTDSTPELTRIHVPGNVKIGVAWSKEADIDLHARTIEGNSLGWNSGYRDGGVYYSGDMTRLNSHGFAAEYMLFNDYDGTAILSANPFDLWGNSELTLDIVISKDTEAKGIKSDVMTTFDDIVFLDKLSISYGKSLAFAVVTKVEDGYDIILSSASEFGNHVRVPNMNTQDMRLQILKRKADTSIGIHDFAILNGAVVTTDKAEFDAYVKENEVDEDNIIDLSPETMTQDKLIELLEVKE